MKVQIERTIESSTPAKLAGLNTIIGAALNAKKISDFSFRITYDLLHDRFVSSEDFFIYYGAGHIAIHEVLEDGNSERLLLIS